MLVEIFYPPQCPCRSILIPVGDKIEANFLSNIDDQNKDTYKHFYVKNFNL